MCVVIAVCARGWVTLALVRQCEISGRVSTAYRPPGELKLGFVWVTVVLYDVLRMRDE